MPVQIGLWRVDGPQPRKLVATGIPLEERLEKLIEDDPTILGEPLLLIGRQVPTAYGAVVDLLAIDLDGAVHILELKRNRTPRDVVAQALDYGSWVTTLTHEDVLETFTAYRPGVVFEQAFTDAFGAGPPEELNGAHRLTIIAGEVDAATERIIEYLNTGFGVPVNVVFFRYYEDEDRAYLARTWLLDSARDAGTTAPGTRRSGSKEPWNGRDWYVSFGEEPGGRNWEDARHFGFVSAGGGEWFSKTLRRLPAGAQIFACIPKSGYVGVGTVTGEAVPFAEAVVGEGDGTARLADRPLTGSYSHPPREDEDTAEYLVPVRWEHTRPRPQAIWVKGMFANQNSACPLRSKFTLDTLAEAFGLHDT